MQTRVSLIKCFEVSDSTHSYSHSPFESFIMLRVIFASFLFLYGANAQLIFPGTCPNVTVQQFFNVSAYLGKWYQYKLYPALFQPNGKCTTATYSMNPNMTVKVYNQQIDLTTGIESDIEGWASQNSGVTNGEAKLTVRFPFSPVGSYWVLSTDYSSYSVVWSCSPFTLPSNASFQNVPSSNFSSSNFSSPNGSAPGFSPPPLNIQFSWVLTRAQIPANDTLATAQQVIDANGLSNNYTITQQTDCPQPKANTGWVPRSSFTYPVALGLFLMFRLVRLNSLTEFLV